MYAQEVGLHVCLETRPIAAVLAAVGLLTSVYPDVALQVAWGVEARLIAVRAHRGNVGKGRGPEG